MGGFSTFKTLPCFWAIELQAAPGRAFAALYEHHQQTCPQPAGITPGTVDSCVPSALCIPVYAAILTLENYFSALSKALLPPKKHALKNEAWPTEPAPNGALAGLSWAHQQRCPHCAGITLKPVVERKSGGVGGRPDSFGLAS